MRKVLIHILRILARRTLARYKPIVIGITGSVGKTTAKEAIYAVLRKQFFVWKNAGNYNNEIGVPLAVLGITPGGSRMALATKIAKAAWHAYLERTEHYPRFLVLELAADRPGDIEYLVRMTQPQIGVVTAIGDVPVHVEYYANPQEVAHEKSHLAKDAQQLVILNADDPIVSVMREVSKAPVVTFGFSEGAILRASNTSYFMDDGDRVAGISFRVQRGTTFLPIRLSGVIGTHQVYGVLSAIAVGLHIGMNLVDIADALEHIEMPKGRMTLLRGLNDTTIIDDTYNASPLSMKAALDTLRQFPAKRRVAILGEMAELGKYSEQEHRIVDELAKANADIVMWCKTSEELLSKVRNVIQEGDVILIKGSHAARMEKIVDVLAEKS